MLRVGAAIGLNGAVDIALLRRALPELEIVPLQRNLAVAGAVLDLLVELDDLFPVAVVLAHRELHRVEPEAHRLALQDRRLAELIAVDEYSGAGRFGVHLERGIVDGQHELPGVPVLLQLDLLVHLLVPVPVEQERIAPAQADRDFGLAVGAGRTRPIIVEVDIHPGQRRHVRREPALRGK